MFKKRTRKPAHMQRRKTEESDDDDEEHDDGGTTASALETCKKRRKLLTQLQYKKGVDATRLMDNPIVEAPDEVEVEEKADLPDNTTAEQDGKVWEQKHATAMEEFVQSRLKKPSPAEQVALDKKTIVGAAIRGNKPMSQDELYRELAEQSAQLAGKATSFGAATQATDNIATAAASTKQNDKDVLTAGAATAMAEVVLPVAERLPYTISNNEPKSAPAGAAAAAAAPPLNRNPAVPNRFRSSHNHHHPFAQKQQSSHAKNYAAAVPQKQASSSSPAAATATTDSSLSSSVDDERLGFAARRQQQGPSKPHRKSADDRVYQQFVKRQRNQVQKR